MSTMTMRSRHSNPRSRRAGFLARLGYRIEPATVLDFDFDNDNELPFTAECLPRTIRLSH